jgi:hypothetical protein
VSPASCALPATRYWKRDADSASDRSPTAADLYSGYHLGLVEPVPFEKLRDSLQPVGVIPSVDVATRTSIQEAADALEALVEVTGEALASLIRDQPDWVPLLGLCCRLSSGEAQGCLAARPRNRWVGDIGQKRAQEIIDLLDELGLVSQHG